NQTWLVCSAHSRYFVKMNGASRLAMFEAEAAGLRELERADAVRVPRAICAGANGACAWLVLEHIELARRTVRIDERLGAALAELHRSTGDSFGWDRGNTI